jgi:hypothetical protein
MKWLAVAPIILLAAAGPNTPSLTVERIAADIGAEGAGPVVHRLWESGEFDSVLDAISSGDSKWIGLSPSLAVGADAGAAEGLGVALARALPINAAAVLAVLDQTRPVLSPAHVCGIPFIEESVKDVADYRRKAEAAVEQIHGASLQDSKAACMAALQR